VKKESISNISLTNWQRVDRLTDKQIDTSDIPLLDEDWFAGATVQWPEQDAMIAIGIEAEIVNWFKLLDQDYKDRINGVLRMYMEPGAQAV